MEIGDKHSNLQLSYLSLDLEVPAFCRKVNRTIIITGEKHNTDVYPMFWILLVLDAGENTYYLDYNYDRGKIIEAFWNMDNRVEINKRIDDLLKR